MRGLLPLFVFFSAFIVKAQETCVNISWHQYSELPDKYYHDNGQIAFKRRTTVMRVTRSKQWDCEGKLLRKSKSRAWWFGKKDWIKIWTATYHPNGQMKILKVNVHYACHHIRRRRFREFDENGKRMRE